VLLGTRKRNASIRMKMTMALGVRRRRSQGAGGDGWSPEKMDTRVRSIGGRRLVR